MTPEGRMELRRARRTQKRGLPKIGAPVLVLAFAVVLVAGALIGYQSICATVPCPVCGCWAKKSAA